MLKFINLKKLTAKTLIGILMVGGLLTPSETRRAFASNGCGNNGHGNNAPFTHDVDGGKLTISGFDPSNNGDSSGRNDLVEDLVNGETDKKNNSKKYEISFTGAESYTLTQAEAENLVDNLHPDWEIRGNGSNETTYIYDCGSDYDGDGISDAVELGGNFNTPIDTDGDGIPDFMDTDSDGDGTLDSDEAIPVLWGIDEDDGQLFSMGDYTDSSTMTDYGQLKWNNNGTIEIIDTDMEAMTLDENGDMYIALDRKLSGSGRGATLLKFNIANAKTLEDGGDNIVRVVGEIGINFDNSDDNVSGLSIDPNTGNLVALLKNDGWSQTDKLYVISKVDGSVLSEIGNITGLGERSTNAEDIEHAPDGSLYVTDNADDHTYKVNGLTGAIIEVIDDNQEDGLGSSSVKFEALGWDFANNRLIGFDDNDESLARLTLENGNNQEYYDTSGIELTDVEGVDFVPTEDGLPTAFLDYDDDGVADSVSTGSAGDEDGNGIPDSVEIGSDPANPIDTDGDTIPDYQDTDDDNNGIPDSVEIGSDPDNPVESNLDNDTIPDYMDLDDDGDGILDSVEIGNANSSVKRILIYRGSLGTNGIAIYANDTDDDGTADYLEEDSDDDGINDVDEGGGDADGDGFLNFQDLDSDNNGILDVNESLTDLNGNPADYFLNNDDDGDGIIDVIEIGGDPDYPTNSDGDTNDGYDYQDTDSDNDGMLDAHEGYNNSLPDEAATTIRVVDEAKVNREENDYELQDMDPSDTENNNNVCVDADKNAGNKCVIKIELNKITNNGTVIIDGTLEGLDYQIYNYAD